MFANYDAWLEQPYQEMYAAAEYEEQLAENSTYETDCCGVEIPYSDVDFDPKGNPSPVCCAKCGEVAGIDITPPDDYNDYEPEPDDYWDDPSLDYYE
jgi:hypothetical protein